MMSQTHATCRSCPSLKASQTTPYLAAAVVRPPLRVCSSISHLRLWQLPRGTFDTAGSLQCQSSQA